MLSKLTLLGLHKYSDGDIWADLTFPEGINKETAIAEILRQCSEFCLLYPDMDYLKAAITAWGVKWYFTFEKWITVINTEYEPLWNLDVHIDISDDATKGGSRSGTTGANTSINGSNTHQNAAYDSDEFKNAEKDVQANTSNSSGSSSETWSETDGNDHEEYRRGNQGITQSQQLLMSELNVRTWNIYSHIADIFANEFCITLYM